MFRIWISGNLLRTLIHISNILGKLKTLVADGKFREIGLSQRPADMRRQHYSTARTSLRLQRFPQAQTDDLYGQRRMQRARFEEHGFLQSGIPKDET
jgi:hypothetical protein